MRKLWFKRTGILSLTIMIICVVVWSIVKISFGSSLTSNEFPLSEKWAAKLQGEIEQITIVDTSIIVARTRREIYALDIHSGNIIWRQSLHWHFSYQPVLVKSGMLYLSDGKGVLALNQSDGKVLWQQSLRHPSGAEVVDVAQDLVAVNDPPYLAVYQAADGALRWEKVVCRERAQAYFFDANIVVPCHGLNVFDALSGETVWNEKSIKGVDRIWKSAFLDGVIYFSQDLKNITAYDVKNRKQLWKMPMAEDYDSFQAYKGMKGHLFVTVDDQLCVLRRDDGETVWCTGDLRKPMNPTIIEDVLYLFNGLRMRITAYDIRDGSEIGRLNFPACDLIAFENDTQLMASSDEFLVFAFGKQIYLFGE